jgi:hypothetical protein
MEKKMKTMLKSDRKWIFTGLISLITIYSCQMGSESFSDFSSGEGTGGSLARFTVTGNNLFTVDQFSLKVFNLANPREPEFMISRSVGFNIETIFPLGKNLFLGSSTGMYIYDITSPGDPKKVTFYEHITSCDPVVSDGKYAYVTLSTSRQFCWRGTNELQIVDLQNLKSPVLVKQYPMTQPRGLAIRNDTLWVCDKGIKILDVSNKQQIRQLYDFNDISAYDIILNNKLALVTGETGFTEYTLENNSIRKLSEIKVSQ